MSETEDVQQWLHEGSLSARGRMFARTLTLVQEQEAALAELEAQLADHRRVVTEYVNAVEDGDRFGALVDLVPGLASDDGVYGDVGPTTGPLVIGRLRYANGTQVTS